MKKREQWITGDGEIVSEREETFAEAFNEEGYRFPAHKAGVRLFEEVRFPESLTDNELGKMTRLSKHMVGQTNMLGYRRNRSIEAYGAEEIGQLVGLSGSKSRAFVSRMCQNHVMRRVQCGMTIQYYINPAYFMASGKRLSLDLFLLFREELTPILPRWVMDNFLRQAKPKVIPNAVGQAEEIIRGGQAPDFTKGGQESDL